MKWFWILFKQLPAVFILCEAVSSGVSAGTVPAQSQQQDIGDDSSSYLYSNKSLNCTPKQVVGGADGSILAETAQCHEDDDCPPWFNCIHNQCKCGEGFNRVIRCNETLQTSAVLDCYCVTFDEERNTTVAGPCCYNCESKRNKKIDLVYHPLPRNLSELNDAMCGRLNREGPLCGQCKNESFRPLAYSYSLACVECPNGHKNWWKYILAAFLPLTLFYFFVLFFKINATSSYLHGFLLYSQMISSPAFARIVFAAVDTRPNVKIIFQIIGSFYGFLSLDFFRPFMDICLNTDTLQTLALDYAIAIYPLLLMIISYALIELHDRNFRIVVQIWKPFRFIFTFFRRNWDSRTSVIDAYATFFLLSFIKFLSVSFDLLIPVTLHDLRSNNTSTVLYYDGSITLFQGRHLPYAISAIAIATVFVILPTALLLLYPFRWFQRFLNCFPIRWHILHTFVDSFQGCYKDGTEPGTRDCRWFAALFLLFRISLLLVYAATLGSTGFEAATIVCVMFVMLLITIQPFKPSLSHFTTINVAFILCLVLFFTSQEGMDISSIKVERAYEPFTVVSAIVGIIPLLLMFCIVGHWLFTKRKWGKEMFQRYQAWKQGYDWFTFDTEDFEASLPDRIVNPQMYHEGNLSSFANVSGLHVASRTTREHSATY